MEAHNYDAAIVFGACDKMLVGNLRALAETDIARQRRQGAADFRDGAAFADTPGKYSRRKRSVGASSLCEVGCPTAAARRA